MARSAPLLTTFSAGEWSPLLHGRSDLAKYANACLRCRNFVPVPTGPAVRRPGTRHVAAVKDATKPPRLIPFEFSTTQAYVIETGDLYFRFYKDRGRIESPPGTPVELAHPYAHANLGRLKWAQSADTLYLAHPFSPPRLLTRSSHTSWTLSLFDTLDGPYLEANTTATTLTPSAATGNGITVTASGTAGINGGAGFTVNDVGRLIRMQEGAVWGYVKIVGWTSATVVTADVKSTLTDITSKSVWRLGAWSGNTGYPTCVAFFQQRLWFANTSTQPNTVWGSKIADFPNFAPSANDGTVTDEHALTFTVADNKVNAIQWLATTSALVIGTVGSEYTATGTSTNEVISPLNPPVIRAQSTVGAADMMPVKIDDQVLFAQRARRALIDTSYSYASDSWDPSERSIWAAHLLRPQLAAIDFQRQPWHALWAALDDGGLIGMTYMPHQDVTGWHKHDLGGAGAAVESLACIPGTTQDELWLAVTRTVNGAPVCHVEYLTYEFWPEDAFAKDYAIFSDASLAYDGWNTDATKTLTLAGGAPWTVGASKTLVAAGHAPFTAGDIGTRYRFRLAGTVEPAVGVEITGYGSPTSVTVELLNDMPASLQGVAVSWWGRAADVMAGLGHLEGETVQVLADGAAHPDRVVSAGAIALDRQAVVAQVGLGYESRLETLSLEGGAGDGTQFGKRQRIHEAVVKLFGTLGGFVGYRDADGNDRLEEVEFRAGGDPMDASPPLFTGDKIVHFPKEWSRAAHVVVKQTQPLPMTVVAIAPRQSVNE